jgi:hypothetical protein
MAQASSPTIDEEFTDEQFRAHLSDLDGVLGTPGGTDYAITLPASGNDVTIGIGSARVAGFLHQVTSDELFTIPAAVGAVRTDIIVARYDPDWPDGGAKPCRLWRVAGSAGGAPPTLDLGPPGAQELPLWQITRSPSVPLNGSTLRDLRRWRTRATASHSMATPTAPHVGEQWQQTDTGKVLVWTGSKWRLVRTVGAHRQAGRFNMTFVNSVASGQINFPDPFDTTPDHITLTPAAITNNTPVVWAVYGETPALFRYVAWSAGEGSYSGLLTATWKAEIL